MRSDLVLLYARLFVVRFLWSTIGICHNGLDNQLIIFIDEKFQSNYFYIQFGNGLYGNLHRLQALSFQDRNEQQRAASYRAKAPARTQVGGRACFDEIFHQRQHQEIRPIDRGRKTKMGFELINS